MNLPTAYTPSRHVRKIRYIDETLQKLLLIGLVLLEAALAAGLAWMMYQHLNQIIEDNLYRVHLADDVPMLTQLMHEEFILLGLFFAVNLIALLTVDLFWRRHVNGILVRFMGLMGKTARLDFTVDPTVAHNHQILDLAQTQRHRDRTRLTEIRALISELQPTVTGANNGPALHTTLQTTQGLLPQPATGPATRNNSPAM